MLGPRSQSEPLVKVCGSSICAPLIPTILTLIKPGESVRFLDELTLSLFLLEIHFHFMQIGIHFIKNYKG